MTRRFLGPSNLISHSKQTITKGLQHTVVGLERALLSVEMLYASWLLAELVWNALPRATVSLRRLTLASIQLFGLARGILRATNLFNLISFTDSPPHKLVVRQD